MKTIKLSKRLKEIICHTYGKRIIDVGCDHGKVVGYLLQNHLCDYAICSDISKPSVNKAKILLEELNIDKTSYSIRCGNGLETLLQGDDVDTVIIAGMGGREIINILSSAEFLPNIVVLQPQNNWINVKNFILFANFKIVYDKIIFDEDKFYDVIVAEYTKNKQQMNEFELYFGKDNFYKNNYDFDKYLDYQERKMQNLLDKVGINNRQNIESMLNLIKQAKQKLGEINE